MVKSQDFIIMESKLNGIRSLEDMLRQYKGCFRGITFNSYLNDLLGKKQMSKSQVYRRTQMGRTYVYQIFSSKRHPSRNKLLQIALALHCDLEETQTLLLLAEHAPLSFRHRRDMIVAYWLNRGCDTFDLNTYLYDNGEEPLFSME